MKQVATILVPTQHNDKTPVARAVHDKVADVLCANWGGCTMYRTHGLWQDSAGTIIADAMVKYEIAMAHTQENRRCLTSLAQYVAQEARQQEVYIVHAAGDVEFVKPPITKEIDHAVTQMERLSAGGRPPASSGRRVLQGHDQAGGTGQAQSA